jgi:hypothetical protein
VLYTPKNFLCIYGAAFFVILGLFGIMNLFEYAANNITSNEDIRHRWNGNKANENSVALLKPDSITERISYYLYGPTPKSRVETLSLYLKSQNPE